MTKDWTEICVKIKTEDLEKGSNIAIMCVPYGIYIEDYSRLEEESMEIARIDLIDEKLLAKDRNIAIIHIYTAPEENPLEAISFIKERYDSENIKHEITVSDCAQEDWINNWKQYFHPAPIGERLIIHPTWIKDFDAMGRKVLNIEPGLAFGTGTHSTTKLCLEVIEKYVDENSVVLDVGCGSGILSIAALVLGAKSATGIDIDELAVKTAIQNGKENNFKAPKYTVIQGDLADKISGKFNIVVTNIVADIIIMFSKDVGRFLSDDGIFIVSGIIDSREDDVQLALNENGFETTQRYEEKGWVALVCKKAQK